MVPPSLRLPGLRTVLPALAAAGVLVTSAPSALAQRHDAGAWFAFAGQGHFDRQNEDARWRWWFDAHARFFDDSDGFHQSIVRPGVGYDLTPNSTLWLGYGWIATDPARRRSFDENRIWQQYTWAVDIASDRFYGRSRLEQRFVDTGDDLGWRFRQFLRYTRPLGRDSQLGLRIWDEFFIHLNDTDWGADTGLDQNRFFAGLGWTLESASYLTLEFGYLNQYVYRENRQDSANHIFAMTLLANL